MTKDHGTLPAGWAIASIGLVADILAGFGFPESLQGRTRGDIPFFKVGDISRAVLTGSAWLREAQHYITAEESRAIRARPLPRGSIVFAKIGEAIRLNRRAVLAQESLVDNNVMGLVASAGVLDLGYLYHFTHTLQLGKLSRSTTVPSIRKSDVAALPLPLPPLAEQRRIVAKLEELLSRLDAGVAALQAARAQVARYRQAVLRDAFAGRLTAAWRERQRGGLEPASALLERIRKQREARPGAEAHARPPVPPLDASALPVLPEGWAWARLGEVVNAWSNGFGERRATTGAMTAVLRLADVVGGRLSPGPYRLIGASHSEIVRFALTEGDLLCIRVNGSPNLVGRLVPVLSCAEGLLFCDHFIRLRLAGGMVPKYVASYFDTEMPRDYVQYNMVSSAGQNTVSQRTMSGAPIPLCCEAEMAQVVAEIDRATSLADDAERQIAASLAHAGRLRQALLKRAFEGRLVPQDPADEPADVLLARIRAEREARAAQPALRRPRRGRSPHPADQERLL